MYFLRRFLRARQHDLKRAKEMYTASMKWRREFGVEEVTDNFHFTERDAFITLYPQGYHKTDKLVRLATRWLQGGTALHWSGKVSGRCWSWMSGTASSCESPAPAVAGGGAQVSLLQCACASAACVARPGICAAWGGLQPACT